MSAPALTIARANRLTKATERMNDLLKVVGDESFQRSQMRLIENDLAHAGYAIGDFLDNYFRKKYSLAQVAEAPVIMQVARSADAAAYTCAGCQKTFDNPKAFQGHGQSRCLQKRTAAAATKA